MRQAQILILKILNCIPVVKIIAFLELKQKLTFFKGLLNSFFLRDRQLYDELVKSPI